VFFWPNPENPKISSINQHGFFAVFFYFFLFFFRPFFPHYCRSAVLKRVFSPELGTFSFFSQNVYEINAGKIKTRKVFFLGGGRIMHATFAKKSRAVFLNGNKCGKSASEV
jgi:hypothetical protein